MTQVAESDERDGWKRGYASGYRQGRQHVGSRRNGFVRGLIAGVALTRIIQWFAR